MQRTIFFLVGLWLVLSPVLAVGEEQPTSTLTNEGSSRNKRDFDWDDRYDYVVVGAGTAGCIAAGNLAAAGYSVKVLERGSRIAPDNINAQILGLATRNWVPPFVADNNLLATSVGTRPDVLTGDVAGGGGMVNSGIAHLGAKGWWNSFGSTKWNFTNITPAFNRLRSKLSLLPVPMVPDAAQKFAASGSAISFLNSDLNNPAGTPSEGFGNISAASKLSPLGIVRDSTLFTYLDVANPSLVDIELRAHATRIKFSASFGQQPRAKRVEYVDEQGNCQVVRARKGVIVSAGAFGSADLLMRSGVGNATDLAALGIPSIVNLPVGAGLKDHHTINPVWVNNCPMNPAELPVFGLTPGTQVVGFVRSPESTHNWPNIQYSFVPLGVTGAGISLNLFIISTFLVDPESTGYVKLASSDPLKTSLKFYDYPGTPTDISALVSSITMAESFMASGPFASCLGPRVSPPPGADLYSWVAANSLPGYHISSTNAIGRVVDDNLRVMGTRGLFVVDASVMPQISPCNTNIPTAVIAERGIELILAVVP